MIILGIDPGTATTGYGVIRVPDDILGRQFEYDIELVAYGNISTPKDRLTEQRLLLIRDQLREIVAQYQPNLMVIEMLFFGANSRTAMSVGQARGVVMLSAAEADVPIHEYSGPQVKLMVAGNGRASKNEIHEAVRKWLGSNGRKRRKLITPKGGHLDDATDALAIAICHVLKLVAK